MISVNKNLINSQYRKSFILRKLEITIFLCALQFIQLYGLNKLSLAIKKQNSCIVVSIEKLRVLLTTLLMLFILPVLADTNTVTFSEKVSSYELAAGDTINISVYREPDLTLQTKLTDAGTVIFPFLGEINASGLTVGQLKEKIAFGLTGRYLVDPKVSVSVVAYREFFVNGEVRNPGAFPYFPGLTTQKAISMAGGFSERASQTEVLIVHEKDSTPIEVGLDASVLPGDVVVVEESFF